jgi:hypothetical protein
MKETRAHYIFLTPFLFLIFISIYPLKAQYFGQNKPAYKVFHFKVYKTPHFEIYHYLKNDSVLNKIAQLSEQWHSIHQSIFKDTLSGNPFLLYSNHADFQQTTAVSGDIDVGTGGVTEALKNRIILPVAPSYAQTDHVLGHEMVHAFQYHLLLSGDSGSLNNLRFLPLWMVEGMAEYFSLGSMDGNTAMWMRDAIANNDFPTLEQMTMSYKYFPYRFGQCFWAMVGKTWGDSVIIPLFRETAQSGYEMAIRHQLGYDERIISGMWKTALVNHYRKYLDIALTMPVGNKILFSKNAGDMNISPAISPDGKYVIFLSEKDVFSFDLYLAEAKTGKIIKKISSAEHNSEIDAFNYIESAGTWSPDGKRFAFAAFADGVNKLVIVNVKKGRVIKEYAIPGVPAFCNPAWSPKEDKIVVSGMDEGRGGLFLFDLNSKKAEQLTFDNFSYLQPNWSNDGKKIVFSTDKPLQAGGTIEPRGAMNIGILDVATKEMKILDVFHTAKNLNPIYSPDNTSIFFLSNRDGFRNLYRYSIDSARVYQMTRFFTGITGITEFSPAVSVARDQALVTYSYFYGGKYSIYAASIPDFKPFEVNRDSINFDAATLPPLEREGNNLVDKNLADKKNIALMPRDSFITAPYRPKFKLDYISNTGVGIGASRFGTGMAGSIMAIFSDIVGQNQVYATLAVNGEIYDIGGEAAYLNSKNKINWGGSVSHIPYVYASYSYGYDADSTYEEYFDIVRLFEDKAALFAFRPISRVHRIEVGASMARYYYRIERYINYSTKKKLDAPAGFSVQGIDWAFVGDNSYFGMTAPMRGYRYRLGVEGYWGNLRFVGFTADYRQYIYKKPFTFAYRLYHYGRYGKKTTFLYPMYLGYPWLVRGYEATDVYSYQKIDSTFSIDNLKGSRLGIANFEVRVPLTGPKKIALIPSNYLFTDLAIFCDAGIAWDENNHPTLKWDSSTDRTPVVSTGISLRINVLGVLVVEPYYAFPLRFNWFRNPVFGINFLPGW